MTTNASVTTHTWPVAVFTVDHPILPEVSADAQQDEVLRAIKMPADSGSIKLQKVIPPNTPGVPHDVTLWQGRSVILVELPEPKS